MKKLLSVFAALMIFIGAAAALPYDIEFGMDLDDIEKSGVEYETEALDELGPFTLVSFEPDKRKGQTWVEVKAVLSEDDGVIGVFQVNGFPENSFNRRWNWSLRQVAKEYGEPLDMFRYAEEHPFNEDMFFLALIGGITDEDVIRETGLAFVAEMIVAEQDDVSRVWVRSDDSIAAVAPASDTEIATVWIAPDVLAKVAGTVRVIMIDKLSEGFEF